jgi:hypothetical protein
MATSSAPPGAEAREFGSVQARRDRGGGLKRAVLERQEAVGVGDDPETVAIALRRRLDGGDGDVDAARRDAVRAPEGIGVMPLAAAGIEERVARAQRQRTHDRVHERLGQSAVEKPPPRRHRFGRIARIPRPPLLRLEQIHIPAARHVEGVLVRADVRPPAQLERRLAVADGAEQSQARRIIVATTMLS